MTTDENISRFASAVTSMSYFFLISIFYMHSGPIKSPFTNNRDSEAALREASTTQCASSLEKTAGVCARFSFAREFFPLPFNIIFVDAKALLKAGFSKSKVADYI